MGAALAASFADRDESLTIVDHNEDRRALLQGRYPHIAVSATQIECDVAVVAVKPKDVATAVDSAAAHGATLIISVAAGVTLASLHEQARNAVVVRAMPNIGAVHGESATALCANARVSEADLERAEAIFKSAGSVVRVREDQMDAVTGLSGSGPAYVFLMAEAMIDAGVSAGLSRTIAEALTVQTIVGAGRLLAEGEQSAAELRADVTTPAGTTAAGLRALEAHGLRTAFTEAVEKATQRSRELGAPAK